ncbi:MAG TPA: nickel pincer cofactor biosynthesis protein LarC [Dehalococcoidia bacterium]|nr:nickel pincer cofactor biosynthesis protein LarC [Dehalococcoidia bacterium]
MRVAYLDCFSGVSGDMLLGAMLDAGLPLADLQNALSGLPLEGWLLSAQKVKRAGITGTHAVVDVRDEQPARTLGDILRIVADARLPDADKERAAAVFRRLAQAEATVHGEPADAVHLHDVGAVDAIVDVVGAVAGLRLLGAERLYCSPLPLGEGEVSGPHGALPVPAPATLALLAGSPARVRAGAFHGELVTPTGAAIVTTLAAFERPEMTVEAVGYGAGTRDPAGRPNVLRLWLGEAEAERATRPMLLIETNIDDMTPEMLAYVQAKLLREGAADAWLTPVAMKKGRSAFVLSVICSEADEERVARLLLRETSTLGVRVRPVHRWEAEREVIEFESSLGPAAVKVKRLPGERPQVAPEFEACRAIAEAGGLPIAEVYRVVQAEGERLAGG